VHDENDFPDFPPMNFNTPTAKAWWIKGCCITG
jgi:hypothetical protein